MRKRITLFLLTISLCLGLFTGCASSGKKAQATLRALVKEGNYSQAVASVKDSKFYQDKNTLLLKSMELGLLLHADGKYLKSTEAFAKAHEIADRLYTKRLSQKIEKWLVNDDEDVYYGEIYERSLIYFYQALNFYILAQENPSQSRTYYQSARAELVGWNSFLDSIRDKRLGETVFKYDLLANVFGGFVHEGLGSSTDLETALTLYQNALDVLFKNYNTYKTFNAKYEKFIEDYEKLPDLKKERIQKLYVQETAFQKSLRKFLLSRLLKLTWKARGKRAFSKKTSELKKFHGLTEEHLKEIRDELESLDRKGVTQVALLLQEGLIPEKVGEEVYFGLGKALRDPESSSAAKVGATALTVFAADVLNLVPPPGASQSPGETYMALNMTQVAVSEAAVAFEVPKIRYREPEPLMKIRVYRLPETPKEKANQKTKNTKTEDEDSPPPSKKTLVVEREVPLVQPLADIAAEAVAENASWRYTRVGTRLALKHAVAIAAAYATYTAMKGDGNNGMAKGAAALQYAASTRAIQATEKADVRYWSTLPSSIRFITFPLEQGEYEMMLVKSKDREVSLGTLQVQDGGKLKLVNRRLP